MSEKWIPVFKTGTHINSEGVKSTWTEADLDAIASKYNPAEHEAPVVIGHPEKDSPAWGWVEAVKREGNLLYVKYKNIIPEFAEMVKKGMFKKRSIALYPDMTLKHVGYLGAMPPAVKGLPDVAFSGDEEKCMIIEFEEYNPPCPPLEKGGINQNRKEARSMKFFEWMKKKAKDEGVELEDLPVTAQSFSEADIQAKVEAKVEVEVEKRVKAKEMEFSEAQKRKETELKTREDALKTQEAEAKKREISSFCEQLQKEGKLTPAQMKYGMGMQTFMEKISEVQETIEFSEGNEKKKQTPFEYFKSFLSSFKKQIEFGEFAGNEKDMGGSGNAGEKLAVLTQQKMKENKNLSYSQAFAEVQAENITLAQEYASELV